MRTNLVMLGALLVVFGGGCLLTAWQFASDFSSSYQTTVWEEFWSIAVLWIMFGVGPLILGAFLIWKAVAGRQKEK